jgi:hypothetical protein
MATDNEDSPNQAIDNAIANLMKQLKSTPKNPSPVPPDVAVKVINTAIAWEKAKHAIKDEDSGFDPDAL